MVHANSRISITIGYSLTILFDDVSSPDPAAVNDLDNIIIFARLVLVN